MQAYGYGENAEICILYDAGRLSSADGIVGYGNIRQAVAGDGFRPGVYADQVLSWAGASQCAPLHVYDAGIIGIICV